MKIVYENGDVVYNNNNYNYGVVLRDDGDAVSILEIGRAPFVNRTPKAALQYCGCVNFREKMREMLNPFHLESELAAKEDA